MLHLRKLRDQTETANLAVVDDESIIVLTAWKAARSCVRSLRSAAVAMVASGVGKAVLATYSDEDVNAIITGRHAALTEKSIVRPGELFKQLQAIRQQGYAVDDEEDAARPAASPPWSGDCGEPLAAISVSGMTSWLTDDRLPASAGRCAGCNR